MPEKPFPPCFVPKCKDCYWAVSCSAVVKIRTPLVKDPQQIPQEKPERMKRGPYKPREKRESVQQEVAESVQQELPEAVVNNFRTQIMRELESGPRTITELTKAIYGEELNAEDPRWMKVYRVASKLFKETSVGKRASSRGVEYYLEGGDPDEGVD